MRLRKFLAFLFLLCILGGAALLINRAQPSSNTSDKVSVTASFYPLYDFTKAVGGQHVEATNITPAGAEPHDYEPSPKSLANAQKSDVFIYNGGNFEPWTDKFASSYKHIALKMSNVVMPETHSNEAEEAGGHESHAHDPHYWLDPVMAQTMVAAIRDSLTKADPEHKPIYVKNADAYIKQLKQLDADFKDQLTRCSHDTIVTSHDAAGYLAERYGFHIEAIAGLSPEQEPSAGKMAEISDLVRAKHLQYILFETLVSPRLADTIAQETGAETAVFDPLEGLTNEDQEAGKTYLSVQRENLATLRAALACQ